MRSFWTTAELRRHGRSARQIASAVHDGALIAVRPGWYAVPGTEPQVLRAARVGGVATAHTAARARGLWTPPDAFEPGASFRRRVEAPAVPVLRVAVLLTGSRTRLHDPDDPTRLLGDRTDVRTYWTDPTLVRAGRRDGMVDPLTMLRDVFRSEPPERALAVLDSALRDRYLRTADLDALAALLPAALGPVLASADPRAQSGIETIVRYLLRLAGLRVEPQVRVDGVGHVDLLVEGRLVIETDGREWHDDEEAFERDRRRDLVAASSRYRTLRFSWFQVLFQWPQVEAAVFAALAV